MHILQRTHNIVKARVIVSYLQAAGVDALLLDSEATMTLPVVGGVRIAVPREQKVRAERLINEAEIEFERREADREQPTGDR